MLKRIDPPFLSPWQAGLCAAAAIVFLSLPVVLAKSGSVTRRELYPALPVEWGGADHIYREMFEQTSDIDMLFVGSSLLYHAIDPMYVAKEISLATSKQATVVMLPYNYRCELVQYLLVRDMLARRKVRMVVLTMPFFGESDSIPHHRSHYWIAYGDEASHGLPFSQRAALYGSSVLGAPRHLLSVLRADRLERSEIARNGGGVKAELTTLPGRTFVRWTPKPIAAPAESLIYSPTTRTSFEFTGPPVNSFQAHFLRRTLAMLRDRGVPVVLLNIPTYRMRNNTTVEERVLWPEWFGMDMPMVGIPPVKLFAGMSNDEIDRLYRDRVHFNINGNEHFTFTMSPALAELFDRYVQRAL
jgi:hypothetical protein